MFPVQVTLHNPAQLNAVLAALNLGTEAQQEPTTAKPVEIAQARAEAKPAKQEAKAPAPAPAAAPAPAPAPAAEPAPAAAITYDQVAKAITDRVKVDRAAVVDTLASFGAKKGTDLKPEQFADFLAALGA